MLTIMGAIYEAPAIVALGPTWSAVCTENLNTGVVVVKSAQDGATSVAGSPAENGAGPRGLPSRRAGLAT